jgi:tetratricopeptide (TPR) repeat protein
VDILMEIKDLEELTSEAKEAYQHGEYRKAAQLYETAVSGYRTQSKFLMAAEMANNQSVALLQAGEAQAALEAVSATDEVFKEAGDYVKQAMAVGNRAAALEALNRLEEAEAAYQFCADLLKAAGETDLRAHVMQSLSAIQIRQGKQLEGITSMQAGLLGLERPSLRQRILKKLLDIPYKLFGR